MYCFTFADSGPMLRPNLDPMLTDFDIDDTAVAQVFDQFDAAGDAVGGE